MVFALIAVGGLQGIVMPAVTALMSRDVPADRQGEVQGAIGSLQGIAAIFGPPLMTGLFSVRDAPGRPCSLAWRTLRGGLGAHGHGGTVPLDRQASIQDGAHPTRDGEKAPGADASRAFFQRLQSLFGGLA